MGADGARQALLAGVNDLGGTLMDENICRAAGAAHGQLMEEDEFRPSSSPSAAAWSSAPPSTAAPARPRRRRRPARYR